MRRGSVLLLLVFFILMPAGQASARPGAFIEREVPFLIDEEPAGTILLRFYESLPDVAYAGIGETYKRMMALSKNDGPKRLEIARAGQKLYLLSGPGGPALIDCERDILLVKDLDCFTNLMSLVQAGSGNCYLDGAPFIRVGALERESVPFAFDYGAYGIDLIGGEDDVWFPWASLSNLFSDLYFHWGAFNGESFFFNNDNDLMGCFALGKAYEDPIRKALAGGRSASLIDYSFRELSFCLAHYYGCPKENAFGERIRELGLAAALTEKGKAGEKVLSLLRSPDLAEYKAGLLSLGLLFEEAHTAGNLPFFFREDAQELERARQAFAPLSAQITDVSAVRLKKRALLLEAREAFSGGEAFYRKGDTAVFSLDSFRNLDRKGWEDFYAGEKELPDPERTKIPDDLGSLILALKRAKEDPSLKYLILDLSCNGGGSLDLALMMVSLLTGKREIPVHAVNSLTGRPYTVTYELDRNLDGRFDEADEGEGIALSIGVLTSDVSFSCANLFALLMKEAGVPILGERSGGGSCAVQTIRTGEGYDFAISSFRMRQCDGNGEEIGEGIPVDASLVREENGQQVYEDFYDPAVLKRALEELNTE